MKIFRFTGDVHGHTLPVGPNKVTPIVGDELELTFYDEMCTKFRVEDVRVVKLPKCKNMEVVIKLKAL